MGHDKNDELRRDRDEQERHREDRRDEGSGTADLGSQDRRREEGDERH